MALTIEQVRARKVGGSDVATILGLNPYKSRVELYHEKRGTIEVEDFSENLPVEAGNVLEDGIAQLAALHMARLWNREVRLRRCNQTLVHPKYEWITVHIDRDVVGEDRGVELKNVGARAARWWGAQMTDEIPPHYLPQPHTYMLVKDYPVWTTAGYFGGADLRLYEIERDPEWDEIIVEETRIFWYEHVLKGEPPAFEIGTPDNPGRDAPRAHAIAKRLYKGTNGQTVIANADDEHWRYVIERAREQRLRYEKIEQLLNAHFLDRVGDGALLEFADGTKLARTFRKEYTRKPSLVKAGYMAKWLKPKGELLEDKSEGGEA